MQLAAEKSGDHILTAAKQAAVRSETADDATYRGRATRLKFAPEVEKIRISSLSLSGAKADVVSLAPSRFFSAADLCRRLALTML